MALKVKGVEVQSTSVLLVLIGALFIFVSLTKIVSSVTLEVSPWNSIILFIVGALLLTYGIYREYHIDNINNNKRTKSKNGSIDNNDSFGFPKVIIIIILVLALIAVFRFGLLDSYIGTLTSTPTPEVKITAPLNTAKLSDIITGISKDIPNGQTVWILIYPHTADKYYPQNKVTNKNWNLSAQFGGANDTGIQFDVLAVMADQGAQNELQAYYDTSMKNNSWLGIKNLPNDTTELARVTVTRV
jgi:hypothetical protein